MFGTFISEAIRLRHFYTLICRFKYFYIGKIAPNLPTKSYVSNEPAVHKIRQIIIEIKIEIKSLIII